MGRCQLCGYRWEVHPHVRCEMRYRDQRKLERRIAQAERERAESEERHRVESLSLYSRIEELSESSDLKAVLHLICERAGIECD